MSFAQELKDFTAGFQSGYKMTKKSWQEKKYEAEAAEDAKLRAQANEDDAGTQAKTQGISQVTSASTDTAGTGSSTGKPAGGVPHAGGADSDPVAKDLAPHQRAFLNAVAGPESAGKYNVRYTPGGGTTFDSFDKHPGIFEKGPAGPSSAAGRYQFTQTTWNRMGGGNFSPENQDRRAWQLAQEDYSRNTNGRNLNDDLQTGGFTPSIAKALGSTWAGFKDNPNKAISWYNSSMKRYAAMPNDAPTQTAAAVRPVESRALPAPAAAPAQAAGRGLTIPFTAPSSQGAMPRPQMGTGVTPTPASTPSQVASADEDQFMIDENGQLVRVQHAAKGGLVPEDEDEDAAADRLQDIQLDGEYASLGPAATEQPTNNLGVPTGQAQTVQNDGDDYDARELVNKEGAAEATHGGLTWIQDTFNLRPKGGLQTASNEDGQRAFASNAGAMSQADKDSIDRTVDPKRQLTPAERNLAGMHATYKFYLLKGDVAKANRMAGAMLMYSRDVTQRMGNVAQAAIERGDTQGATQAMKTAMDAVPNGQTVEFGKATPRGVQYKLINSDGTLSESGVATNDQLLQRAIGMSNGTAWLEAVVSGAKAPTAKQRQDAADRKNMEAFENEQFSSGDVSEYEAGLSPRARELWAKLPMSAKNAKIRQFMAEKRANLQGEQAEQRAAAAQSREEARAKAAEAKEKAAADKAAQKELEIKTDQEASIHADNIRSAQQAVADAQESTDPDALPQAQQALAEARAGAQQFLQTQQGSKDALRKYGAMFGMAGRGGLKMPGAGGSGSGSGGGKTAEEREGQAATREANAEIRGLNLQRKKSLNELGHEVMGDQQGPVSDDYTRQQAPDKAKAIDAAAISGANVERAEENYRKVMADKETKGLTFKDRLDNPEVMGGIDKAIDNIWNAKTSDGKTRKPLDQDKKLDFRNIASHIMRANPNIGVDEAAILANAAARPDTNLGFDKRGRLVIDGTSQPIIIGRDGIAMIQRLRRGFTVSASPTPGGGKTAANPFSGEGEGTGDYQSPADRRRAAAAETQQKGLQVDRAAKIEAGKKAMAVEYQDLKRKLTEAGDWEDSMSLAQARKAWRDYMSENPGAAGYDPMGNSTGVGIR